MTQKVLLATGAAGVLGRALVRAARADGWRVAAVDFAAVESADEGVLALGGVDLTDAQAGEQAVSMTTQRFGRLDALANVAGGFVWTSVSDAGPEVWDRLHRLNLATTVNACRAALPELATSGRGRIVNVGAAGAVKAAAGMGPYAASKASVHRLTEALAEEWKGRVAVNAVLPSILDTPQNRADMPDADPSAWVAPEALARVMLWLLSEDAGPVTGALVPVTGGV